MSRRKRLINSCSPWLIRATACLLCAMVIRPGVAQEKTLQVYDGPVTRLEPVRVGGARLLDDGRVIQTTEWMDYRPRGSTSGSSLKCWDAFGNDGVSAPYGAVECGLPRQ